MGVPEHETVGHSNHETVENSDPASVDAGYGLQVHLKTYIVVASVTFLYVAQMVAVVGSGVLSHSIAALFQSPGEAVWLSTGLGICVAVLSLPVCQIGDCWGRRWPLVISAVLSFVGCIVASRAQTMGTVIAGFVIVGVGTGSQSLLLAVASEVLPRRQRPYAQAIANCGNLLGTIIAICMGGALLRNNNLENYRVYMYVAAAFFAVAVFGVLFGYNPPAQALEKSLTTPEKLRRMDWIGTGLLASGLSVLCVGLAWSRNPYPWSDPRVSATFAIGLALALAFAVYEWRFTKQGLLHHDLFRNRNLPLAVVCIACEGMSFYTINSFFIFQIIINTHQNSLLASIHYLLTFITAMFAALTAGWFMTRFRSIRIPTAFGLLLILVFDIVMTTAKPSTGFGVYWGIPIVLGAGFGITLPSISVAVQLSTPGTMISLATGFFGCIRALGATIGLAINNAIFNNTLAAQIPKQVAEASLPLGLPETSLPLLLEALAAGTPSGLASVPGLTPEVAEAAAAAYTSAYNVGFRDVWIASACFIFLAFVLSLFLTDPRSEFNAHIDRPAEVQLLEEQERLDNSLTPVGFEDKAVARPESG